MGPSSTSENNDSGRRRKTVMSRTHRDRSPARLSICAIAICVLSLPACVPPVVSLAGAALSALNEGGQTSARPGPFSGGPSSIQNQRPGDPAISEAVAHAGQRQIMEKCTARLPLNEPPPSTTGCTVRPVCLPGSTVPLRLRVCSRTGDATVTERATPRPPGWKWDMSEVAGDPR